MAIAAWFRSDRSSRVQEEELHELTEQFYVTLGAYFARVSGKDGHPTYTRVLELFKQPNRTWTGAYEIEQLLIQLYDDDTVAKELDVREIEARNVLRKEQTDHYQRQVTALRTAEEPEASRHRRILLGRLVNDLQWRYTVDEARRRYSKAITSRAGRLFVGALFLLSAGIVVKILSGVTFTQGDLRLFLFAGLAGAWGAGFSMLSTMRRRLDDSTLDDLKLMRPWVMLTSRMLIGAGAACILYFFILAGLLGGTAFPRLIEDGGKAPTTASGASETSPAGGPGTTAPATSGRGVAPAASGSAQPVGGPLSDTQFALLIVWCFIAGFSEQLVPGLLARTEARADARGATDDRYRPTGGGGGGAAGGPADGDQRSAPRGRQEKADAGRRSEESEGAPGSKARPTT